MNNLWCLVVSIACPDDKRPCVDTMIHFFETKQQAAVQLKLYKVMFIVDHDTTEDPRIETLTENSPEELIETLFERVSDPDTYFRDILYMGNKPFYSNLIEVKPEAVAKPEHFTCN